MKNLNKKQRITFYFLIIFALLFLVASVFCEKYRLNNISVMLLLLSVPVIISTSSMEDANNNPVSIKFVLILSLIVSYGHILIFLINGSMRYQIMKDLDYLIAILGAVLFFLIYLLTHFQKRPKGL